MDRLRQSLDGDSLDNSHGESEVDRITKELNQKQTIINEKSTIISSLRQQVQDLKDEIEELENNEQLLNQKNDRFKKEIEQKNEEIESISHALKEVESANDTLTKRLEGRTSQLQKFVDDLTKANKELEESRSIIEQLQHKNEQLTVELDLANSRKKTLRNRSQEEDEAIVQELAKLKQEFEITESSWRLERHHKERYAQENSILDRKVNLLNEELRQLASNYKALELKHFDLEQKFMEQRKLNEQQITPPIIPTKSYSHPRLGVDYSDENKPELTSALHFPIADEIGQIMDSSSALARDKRSLNDSLGCLQQRDALQSKRTPLVNYENSRYRMNNAVTPSVNDYCVNHRIQKSSSMQNHHLHQQQQQQQSSHEVDPFTEQKLRMERANELARRNMRTKPLHQTSYPLELDTFDTADITEAEIKRGNVQPRPALANYSNQRKPVKKAEAFIV